MLTAPANNGHVWRFQSDLPLLLSPSWRSQASPDDMQLTCKWRERQVRDHLLFVCFPKVLKTPLSSKRGPALWWGSEILTPSVAWDIEGHSFSADQITPPRSDRIPGNPLFPSFLFFTFTRRSTSQGQVIPHCEGSFSSLAFIDPARRKKTNYFLDLLRRF